MEKLRKTFICLKFHKFSAVVENYKPMLVRILSLICMYYSSAFQIWPDCSFEIVGFRIFCSLLHIYIARMDQKEAYYCFHTEVILFRIRS